MSLLTVKNLSYTYPGSHEPYLKSVSFSLEKGQKLGITGLNGAGKSTLLNTLMGFNRPFEGEISYEGRRLTLEKDFEPLYGDLSLLLQNASDYLIFPEVKDEVIFAAINRGLTRKEALDRALEVMRALGIDALIDKEIDKLSMGQKRLIALVELLAMKPTLLLLDEPTAGLSHEATDKLSQYLLNDDNLTLIIVSHQATFLEKTCSQIALMTEGALVI